MNEKLIRLLDNMQSTLDKIIEAIDEETRQDLKYFCCVDMQENYKILKELREKCEKLDSSES